MYSLRALSALTLMVGATASALAIPWPGSPAIQPANNYAVVSAKATSSSHEITISQVKPGYGVFWAAIFPKSGCCSYSPKSAPPGWTPQQESGAAVWRTNTGSAGYWLGTGETGTFKASARGGCTAARYVIHVINLKTCKTFWAYPNTTCTPPPPPVNEPPVRKSDCVDLSVDSGKSLVLPMESLTKQLLANFVDPEGDKLTLKCIGQPTCGSVQIFSFLCLQYFIYKPTEECCESVVKIPYTVTDGKNTANASICIKVVCDPPPTCEKVLEVANGEGEITLDVLKDPNYTITAVQDPPHGSATILGKGRYIGYLPDAGYKGEDTFEYTYKDSTCRLRRGLVCLTVLNQPPHVQDECNTSDNVVLQGQPFTINVLANDFDPNPGDTLTLVSVGNPGPQGSGDVVYAGSEITFTAAPDFEGEVTLTYTVSDGETTSQGQVCLSVVKVPMTKPECEGILLFGWDFYLTDNMKAYMLAQGYTGQIDIFRQPAPPASGTFPDGELTSVIQSYMDRHNGKMPCAMMFDPEYIGPYGQWRGMGPTDQETLKSLLFKGMGFVYAEPSNDALPASNDPGHSPQGQIPFVIPVKPGMINDYSVRYNVVNPYASGHPVLEGIPSSFLAVSMGQNQRVDLLPPADDVMHTVTDEIVTYPGQVNLLFSSSAFYPEAIWGTGGITSYAFEYKPTQPDPLKPGARVAILGTDPYPVGENDLPVSEVILKLYSNALKWTAGL